MSAEDRLRTALSAVADDTPVDPGSFDRIERRATRARRRRAVGGGLAAVALVAVAVTVPLALRDDGGEPVQTGPASDTRESTTTTTSTTIEPDDTGAPTLVDHDFVWPGPGDARRFDDPLVVATAFVREYLGMVDAVVEPAGDGTFTARPGTEGGGTSPVDGPRTFVHTASPDGRAIVTGADSPNIRVEAPARAAEITSPVVVSGRARNLFEGNVVVDVRAEGTAEPLAIGATTAAGSGPELAPFTLDLPYELAPVREGVIVVRSDSGLAGTAQATVVPVRFGPQTTADTTDVTVHLLDAQQDFVPVTRQVPRTTGVLRAALLELLEGATPEEEARGLTSPFDDDADLLRGVTISENGTAVVDLVPDFGLRIPNSSTSAMSYAILGSLDRTVFQFPSVTWVSYRFGGECGTFFDVDPEFLCEPRTRDQY